VRPERARVETSAGGVIVRRNGVEPYVLLIRDPYENWGLPKGHLEPKETPVQAATREVAEETGLTQLDILDSLPTIDWYFRDRGQLVHKFCHFFLIECACGDPTPQVDEGISACVWLTVPEAIRTVTYANAREVLQIASARLNDLPGEIVS
jgi:8-oxo-dGTP pyrophosphatase MutT (NUDIX family)